MENSFTVASYRKNYEVIFTDDFSSVLHDTLKSGDVVLIDRNVRLLFSHSIDPVLSNHRVIQIEPTEDCKSFSGVHSIILDLIENGFKKNHRLVAIGGGITQDLTAFTASILYRGVGWIFVPTNLLSQCDSCIGSKTSINFGNYKNQIGSFYPPQLIISDQQFLENLDNREIRSGLGEMAHYFLVEGEEAFPFFERNLGQALARGPALKKLIHLSLDIKRKMIELDEFDEGPRNVFNYGHSFGHAIEGYTKFCIPHGLAVSFGMEIANAQSVRLGLVPDSFRRRVRVSLEKIWRTAKFPDIDAGRYLEILQKDKKNADASIHVVLTRGLGDMFVDQIEVNGGFIETLKNSFASFRT